MPTVSYDSLDVSADADDLWATRVLLIELPVTVSSVTYWFDAVSESTMSDVLLDLQTNGGTVDWRDVDGTATSFNATTLGTLYNDLKIARGTRAQTIDSEYQTYKALVVADTLTQRDLEDWKALHGA